MKYLKKFESPDYIVINPNAKYEQDKNIVTYRTGDAIPFAFMLHTNEARCGNYGEMHGEDRGIDLSNGGKFKLPGRLWVEHKVISFWLYPHPEEFVELMENLEEEINNKYKELDIDFFNDGWKIEVVKVDNDIKTIGKYDTDNLYSNVRSGLVKFKEVLIPIEEYTGSEDQPEEMKAIHLMKAKDREEYYKQHGKPKGFGSEYVPKHKLKDSEMTPAQYKSLTTFSESMITKFKIFEDAQDVYIRGAIADINIASYLDDDARAFGYTNEVDVQVPINYIYDTEESYQKKLKNYIIKQRLEKKQEMLVGTTKYIYHWELKTKDDYQPGSRRNLKYPGRLWLDKHIISFWWHPEKEDLHKLLKDIQLNLHGEDKINWRDDWKIEIVDKYDNYELIPLKDYTGSLPWDEKTLNKIHSMSPKEKHKILMEMGYRSKNVQGDYRTPSAAYKDITTKYKYTEGYDNKI